jgi:hypothetical protein
MSERSMALPAKTAIATLCIGAEYVDYWNEFCAKSWRAYAQRHGYAIEVINEAIDTGGRHPVWQKCLILGHPRLAGYDRVVWIDADIVINDTAPAIVDGVPPDKIGAVVSGDYLQREMKAVFIERARGRKVTGDIDQAWAEDQRGWYERNGVRCNTHDIVQTGVLVLAKQHRAFLEGVYRGAYSDKLDAYEQVPLSAAMHNQGLFHRIDSRFNMVFYERMQVHYPYLQHQEIPHYGEAAYFAVMTEYANSFFLHFAYKKEFAQFLNTDVYK